MAWEAADREPLSAVVFIPPFGEEMNKCRRMLALQAQALAGRGITAILPDLAGTGDSERDFSSASWDDWLCNVRDIVDWTRQSVSKRVDLLAVRSGALLALEAMQTFSAVPERMVLWAPTVSGRQFMSQFLRMRLASELNSDAGTGNGTAALWQLLERGQSVEVAGYGLPPTVAISLRDRELEPLLRRIRLPIAWFEVVSNDGIVGVAARRVCESLLRDGFPIRLAALRGETFWTTPEIALVPGLVRDTTSVFTERENGDDL